MIRSATEIADRDGLNNLTLAKVADSLGVRSPSLYAHVEGINGLRRALQIHAARLLKSAFTEATAGKLDDQGIRDLADAYRRFAHTHPGLLDALHPAPRPGEDDEVYNEFAESARLVANAVMAVGVAPDDAVYAVRSLRSALHGFVVLEKEGGFGMPVDIDHSFAAMVQLIINGLSDTFPPQHKHQEKDK